MGDGKPALETAPVAPSLVRKLRDEGRATRASLVVYHRQGAAVVPLLPGAPLVVGRDPDCDVPVDDPSLSRRHARVSLGDDGARVEDLGSTNGTWIDGERVSDASLPPGCELLLGTVVAGVHVLGATDGAAGGILGHDAFRTALEAEVVRARFFSKSLALVLVRAADQGSEHVRHFCPQVQASLRPVDRVGLYSSDVLEILLPEAGEEEAARLAAIVAKREPRLLCGVAVFPDSGSSADELLESSRDALRGARASEPVRAATGRRTWTHDRPATAGDPVSASEPMRAVLKTAARLARGIIPVLLQGDTGTGKEVVARFIHDQGPRRERPLVCVNCAAIPSQLVESTLFGHERGAFTGAAQQQKGVFESAHGGTVLLDEVGELPAAAQAVLLRVLEAKRFSRVGSTKEIEVDVRVIAATNRDLVPMVAAGSFRLDLLHRLNAMTLELPPLRERRQDVGALASRFLGEANEANGTKVRHIDPDALAVLEAHGWPGNVRELRNVIERAVVIAQTDEITVDDLPTHLRGPHEPLAAPTATGPPPHDPPSAEGEDLRGRMDRLEAEAIVEALRRSDWNQRQAAKRLGMPLRTLVYKIKLFGIKRLGYGLAKE